MLVIMADKTCGPRMGYATMSTAEVLLGVFERMNCAGLVLDGSGQVRCYNVAAGRCLERHSRSRSSRPERSNGWATQALRTLLGRRLQVAGPIDIATAVESDGERPVVASAMPLPGSEGRGPEILLVLADLNGAIPPGEGVLRRIFDLTRAEARIAAGLARGEGLQDIADAHGIALGTARIHLKSIFAKTNTSRQAELVAVLNRLAMLPAACDVDQRP